MSSRDDIHLSGTIYSENATQHKLMSSDIAVFTQSLDVTPPKQKEHESRIFYHSPEFGGERNDRSSFEKSLFDSR